LEDITWKREGEWGFREKKISRVESGWKIFLLSLFVLFCFYKDWNSLISAAATHLAPSQLLLNFYFQIFD
jgi:hypothetical protein